MTLHHAWPKAVVLLDDKQMHPTYFPPSANQVHQSSSCSSSKGPKGIFWWQITSSSNLPQGTQQEVYKIWGMKQTISTHGFCTWQINHNNNHLNILAMLAHWYSLLLQSENFLLFWTLTNPRKICLEIHYKLNTNMFFKHTNSNHFYPTAINIKTTFPTTL